MFLFHFKQQRMACELDSYNLILANMCSILLLNIKKYFYFLKAIVEDPIIPFVYEGLYR